MSEADALAACAESQVGKRYVWATAGPDTFDCSGLVAFCWRQATGEHLTRSSFEQARLGTPVTGPIQRGDLLVYGDGAHIGIATTQTSAVHALNATLGVLRTGIPGNLGLRFTGARRVFSSEHPSPPDTPNTPKRPRRKRRKPRRVRRR